MISRLRNAWKAGVNEYRRARGATASRRYAGAQMNRLTADWITGPLDANAEVAADLGKLRDRARELANNDSYFCRYLRLSKTNVVFTGIALQMDIRDANGQPDTQANDMIEAAWEEWGRDCAVTGRHSWWDILCLADTSWKRDGEAFIRLHRGWPGNRFRFAVELIESDLCDHTYTKQLSPTRYVVNGVEVDQFGRVYAYYFSQSNPLSRVTYSAGNRVRIPAEEILHLYDEARVGQLRGVTRAHAAMMDIANIRSYREAALVAARAGACQMAFVVPPAGQEDPPTGEAPQPPPPIEAEPGSIPFLPAGYDLKNWSPNNPSTAYRDYNMSVVFAICAGLGASYSSLSGDLSNANFGSTRVGMLDERDGWRMDGQKIKQIVCGGTFVPWLEMALTAGAIITSTGAALPLAKFDKFNRPTWWSRAYPWIDPKTDADAKILERNNGWTADSSITEELGRDYEDVCRRRARDMAIRQKYGLPEPSLVAPGSANTAGAVTASPQPGNANGNA